METNDELTDLLLRHPGLLVDEHNSEKLRLRGLVRSENFRFCLELICPDYPNLQGMILKVDEVHEKKSFTFDTCPGLKPEWKVKDLIESLPNILNKKYTNLKTPISGTKVLRSHQNIYGEISALYDPELYKVELNESCTRIRFSEFAGHELHFLELELPSLHIVTHSLPDVVPWQELLQKCPSLTTVVEQFQKFLEELRPFYDTFISIDELCYVLQPLRPSTKDISRMFMLQERVFLKLSIADPLAPTASMSVNIIGPSQEVKRLRRVYSEGLSSWNAEKDVHGNLLRIFDLIYFPMPPVNSNDEDMERIRCNICFCYDLDDGEVPVVSCDNARCSTICHASCLKRWFNTLSDGKQFLNVSFGTCPFCKSKLSTSFVELLEE